jgi:hypothetical protein
MFSDVKTQLTESQLEGLAEPSMLAIQRSREAALCLWAEIGRLLAGNPFAPAAALTPGASRSSTSRR